MHDIIMYWYFMGWMTQHTYGVVHTTVTTVATDQARYGFECAFKFLGHKMMSTYMDE